MNRQRGLLLAAIVLLFFASISWMVYTEFTSQQNTFVSGAPPQSIQDVIIPKELDPSLLHPPALLTTDPIRYGGATSSASVIEYGDYQCEACKNMSPILNRVVASYRGKIRLVWHDLALAAIHGSAVDAAVFARCAGRQGKFWEANDALMQADSLDEFTLQSIAQKLQLDQSQLTTCRNDANVAATVKHDGDVANGDGIDRAPTIFVGTKAFIGAMSEADLRAAIDAFLKS